MRSLSAEEEEAVHQLRTLAGKMPLRLAMAHDALQMFNNGSQCAVVAHEGS